MIAPQRKNSSRIAFLKKIISGETVLERVLSTYTLITFFFSIACGGYWYLARIEGKSTFYLLSSLLLFGTSLMLRVRLLKDMKKIEGRVDEIVKALKISREEAKIMLKNEVEVKTYRDWISIILITLLLGGLITYYFP